MSNNELLTAISGMMDVKLKATLQPLVNNLQDIKVEVQNVKLELQREIQIAKDELHKEIQSLWAEMQSQINELWTEIQNLRQEMQGQINELWTEIQSLRQELQDVNNSLQFEIHQLKLTLETQILPRLNTIEVCYLDTYRRYRDNADKMDSVFEDVTLIKETVTDHSIKLQELTIAS